MSRSVLKVDYSEGINWRIHLSYPRLMQEGCDSKGSVWRTQRGPTSKKARLPNSSCFSIFKVSKPYHSTTGRVWTAVLTGPRCVMGTDRRHVYTFWDHFSTSVFPESSEFYMCMDYYSTMLALKDNFHTNCEPYHPLQYSWGTLSAL